MGNKPEIEPNKPEANQLTRKQREAIPHLIGARSFEEGRKAAKVGKATLYNWLRDKPFQLELERQREKMITEALDRLKSAVTRAVDTLVGLIDTPEDSLKLRVCQTILEFFLKSKELEEITKRVEALEKAVKEKRP